MLSCECLPANRERSNVRLSSSGNAWLLMGACALLVALAAPAAATSQFTPFRSNDHRTMLEGNWQSCREADGHYSERVYDHVVNGEGQFELHMGPHREFGLFKGVQEDHRAHESADNLLKPYRLVLDAGRAKQRWEIPSLNLALTVTLAGGSRMDCESWFIVLEPLEKTSY
jgi:hypothetical protein